MNAVVKPDLSSVEMERLFKDVFDSRLVVRKFENVGKNRWVRETTLGFKHVFYFYPRRPGSEYYPHGALSFDYVPRVEAGKICLKTKPKFARVHLSVGKSELVVTQDWSIARGRSIARERCEEVANMSIKAIDDWLLSFKSLSDVLVEFGRRQLREGNSFYCYPETTLSYAFTLAATGNKESAVKELDRILQSSFDVETHAPIREYFQKLIIAS